MDFKEIISEIESSKEFKNFKSKNSDYYLAHVFRIVENDIPGTWQIGYYSKTTDKIVVFEYSNDIVLIHPPEEALKKEEYIQKLDISKTDIAHLDITSTIKDFFKENYKYDLPNKEIYLLQNLPEHGQVWNVTLITLNFSVINIKVDASNGNVVKHEKHNLMQWNSKS